MRTLRDSLRWLVRSWRSGAVVTLLALSACGGGDGVASGADTGTPLASTLAEVGAGGATLTLEGLTLTLPPNALLKPVNVSIAAQVPGPGEIARFKLAPAGQRFGVAGELRFARSGLPAKTSFFWEVGGELRLVPSTLNGDVLTARISSLGLTASGNLLPAEGEGLPARAKALAARLMAEAPGEGGALVAKPVDCAKQIPELSSRLKAVAAGRDQELAVTVFNELEATKQICLESDLQALQKSSCEALQTAQLAAQSILANNLTTFREVALPLFSAEAFVQLTGATCATVDSANVGPLIAAKFEQLLQVLQSQQLRDGFAAEATIRDLRTLFSFQATCDQLELGTICDRLSDEIFPNLLDGMRRAAFDECRSTGAGLVVSQFHFLGTNVTDESKFLGFGRFGLADVEADLSYCTNPSLDLRVFADATGVPDEITDRASTLRPLVGLGNYARSTTVAVPRDGSLTVSGQVSALRCADGTASTADLVARIGTREVARRSVSGNVYSLATAPLDLVFSQVLVTAGLDPEATTAFTVTINREGGQCLGALGPTLNNDFTLFEIRVNLPAAPNGPIELRGSANLISTTTTTSTRDGNTSETVDTVSINAPVRHDAARGHLMLLSSGFSGTTVRESRSVTAIERSPCFFDAVTERVERTTFVPRGPEFGTIGFQLTGDNWVLGSPTLPVTEKTTTTTRQSTTNVRGDCSGFDLTSTTRIEELPARSGTLDPELSLTNTPVFQGSLSRDAQGLRSLVFSDTLTQSETRFDPSRSVKTSVQLTLRDQPAP